LPEPQPPVITPLLLMAVAPAPGQAGTSNVMKLAAEPSKAKNADNPPKVP
jgi:hypothetical protein